MKEILEQQYGKFPGFTGLVKYCETNNILNIPKCADDECTNVVTYNKAYPNRGFGQYCSPDCSRKNKTIPRKTREKLEDYDWLFNQRITLRKSKEQIAKELGISRTPIVKYLNQHNIPDVKYNTSMCSTLDNKKQLEELYNNNKLVDIANALNVSVSTISRFFQKHNISTRNPNFYERSINNRSKGEKEVCEFLESHGISFESNTRKYGFEIDILSGNFAIEYNGLYYHSDKFKDKDFHITKTKKCQLNDITLFHLWEDQWNFKQDIVKSTLLHKFNKPSRVIYARKCDVLHIPGSQSRLFLDNNHLQGYCSASIKLGLMHNNELVALMTFSKPRFNKHYDWELVRFATLNYTHIPGAFSKLLKAFRKHHTGSIVTYADITYSDGNVYKQNGFIQQKINKPSYSYVLDNKRVSRTRFIKKNLQDFDDSLTEEYITKTINIHKIWDCGTIVFTLE